MTMPQKPEFVALPLSRAAAIVLCHWLSVAPESGIGLTHPADRQALADLLNSLETTIAVPDATQLDQARSQLLENAGGWVWAVTTVTDSGDPQGYARPNVTDAELEGIRKRLESATPGPWTSMVERRDHTSGDSFILVGAPDRRADDLYLSRGSYPASAADQDFVAAARQDIPRLLREIERLKSMLER